MSEINDEGLLPPNVHHARPESPRLPDEDADRERAAEDTDEDTAEQRTRRESTPDDSARQHPHAEHAGDRAAEGSDDPYAKRDEDSHDAGAPAPDEDGGRVDGRTGVEGTGDETDSGGASPARPTSEPPD